MFFVPTSALTIICCILNNTQALFVKHCSVFTNLLHVQCIAKQCGLGTSADNINGLIKSHALKTKYSHMHDQM